MPAADLTAITSAWSVNFRGETVAEALRAAADWSETHSEYAVETWAMQANWLGSNAGAAHDAGMIEVSLIGGGPVPQSAG